MTTHPLTDITRTTSGATLHLTAGLLTATTLTLGLATTHLPTALIAGLLIGALTTWRPTLPTLWITLATITLPLLLDNTFNPLTLLLAPLIYLTHRATWWARHTTRSTHIDTAALATELRPATLLITLTLTLGTLAAWTSTALAGHVALPVGAAALLVTVLLAVPSRWWR